MNFQNTLKEVVSAMDRELIDSGITSKVIDRVLEISINRDVRKAENRIREKYQKIKDGALYSF